MNATYITSIARKLGCSIFLLPEDITEVADDGYGSLPSYSSKLYVGLPPPSTLEMVVPGHAVGKVMGKGGANIGNIRKLDWLKRRSIFRDFCLKMEIMTLLASVGWNS